MQWRLAKWGRERYLMRDIRFMRLRKPADWRNAQFSDGSTDPRKDPRARYAFA